MMNKKLHHCFCGGDVEISEKTLGSGMDGCYQNWEICCKKCGGNWQWAADEFYGREYYSKDEVIDLWNDLFEPIEEGKKGE